MDEDRLPLVLKAEEHKHLTEWYAAASLMDYKELVHYLVQHARFDYPISVVDRDFLPVQILDIPGTRSGGGILGGIVGGSPTGQVQWPDEIVYKIVSSSHDDEGALTCCLGGVATYLQARSTREPGFPDGQSPEPGDWGSHDKDVIRILLSIAHPSWRAVAEEDFPIIRGGKATIVWHSLDQARPLHKEAIDQYVSECGRMLTKLGEPGLTEPEIRSKVRIRIRDWRRARAIPIPDVGAGVEFNVCADSQRPDNWRCVD